MRHRTKAKLAYLIVLIASCGGATRSSPKQCTTCKSHKTTNASNRPLVLSIVGTNDVHGRLASTAWLGGYLNVLRERRREDQGAVLLLDAGDMFQGTLESNLGEGASMVQAYNLLGYDAVAVGNHEFDYGPVGPANKAKSDKDDPRGALAARIKEAKFPFLVANIYQAKSQKRWLLQNLVPSIVVKKAGLRIGLIGLLASNGLKATLSDNVADLSLGSLKDAAIEQARLLRAQGCDLVIITAHTGGNCRNWSNPDDLSSCAKHGIEAEVIDLANAMPAGLIDAIVGGHTHAPVAHRVGGIPVIESFSYGVAFGRIDLAIDRQTHQVVERRVFPPQYYCTHRKEADAACQTYFYEGQQPQRDRKVEAFVQGEMRKTQSIADRKLGVVFEEKFDNQSGREADVGNWFTDMMRAAVPSSDMALINGGALRSDIPQGELTYGTLYRVIPFDNALATAKLTGAQIKEVIKKSVSTTNARIISISGVAAEITCQSGRAEVILHRKLGSVQKEVGDDDVLEVVTDSFLLAGGDSLLGRLKVQDIRSFDDPVRDVIANYLTKRGGMFRQRDHFDRQNRRISFEGTRPLRCKGATETAPAAVPPT